jgi:GT2 family glycosyltransferase
VSPDPVGLFVLNYNNHDDTERCIRSALEQKVEGMDLVLVDNGSTNDSSERVAKGLCVELLRTGSNLGYAGGMNRAMREARKRGMPVCLLCSTDVVFLDGAIGALLEDAARVDPAVMAPVHVAEDGTTVASAGKGVSLSRGESWHLTEVMGDAPFPVAAVDGAVLLVDVERVLAVGGFDERYFMYWEDVDLGLRLRARGERVMVCPTSRVVHRGSGTAGVDSPLQVYYSTRNRILFLKAYASAGAFLAAVVYQKAFAMPLFMVHIMRVRNRGAARALVMGFLDGLLRSSEPPPGADPLARGT